MSEWRETALGDVLEVHHGYAFKGEFFVDDGPDVLLTPKNFRAEGGLDVAPDRCKRYAGPVDPRFVLAPGDVVIAMTDLKQDAPILGATGRVPRAGRYLHNQRIGKVKVLDTSRLSPVYVPWLLNAPDVRSQVRATATGATVRHTAPERIHASIVRLPPEPVQRKIATILSRFDMLIAINERRIQVLQDLARSLYREWFVREGAAHRQGVRVPLFAAADVGFGYSFKSPGFGAEGPHAVVRIRDVPSGTTSTFTNEAAPDRYSVRDGDVLIGMDGEFHLNRWSGGDAWLNQRVARLRPISGISAYHLMQAVADPIKELNRSITGTTVAHLGKRHLEGITIPVASASEAVRVGIAFDKLGDTVLVLRKQDRALATTRDALLPRLVTGRLDISDVDLGDLLPAEAE